MKFFSVAIDGPAGAGKSTIAKINQMLYLNDCKLKFLQFFRI